MFINEKRKGQFWGLLQTVSDLGSVVTLHGFYVNKTILFAFFDTIQPISTAPVIIAPDHAFELQL